MARASAVPFDAPAGAASSDRAARLDRIRRLQYLLDQAFRVPGTKFRFGWDPIVGLVPWAGDLLTALMACTIVFEAHHMRVPRVVQLRMLLNIGIDVIIGIVPFIGDIADVMWKANAKNLALLERHAASPAPPSAADWAFVIAVIAAIVFIAIVPVVVMYWLVHAVLGRPFL